MRSESGWKNWFERRERKKKKTQRNAREREKPRPRSSDTTITGIAVPRVVGEARFFVDSPSRSNILNFSDRRRKTPTAAEEELWHILNQLNSGVLRGRFKREHAISGKWIVDFFFPEIRLAIEVDGPIHSTIQQKKLDKIKDRDCARLDITLLRIKNHEVFGNRNHLIAKLRAGWRRALTRENCIIGMDADEYLRKRKS